MSKIDQSRLVCKVAFERIRAIRQAGRLYRGNSSIADDKDDLHDAYSWVANSSRYPAKIRAGTKSTVHIDQDVLRGGISLTQLAELLVHEGMHFGFAPHPNSEHFPYSTYPYDEAASCVN